MMNARSRSKIEYMKDQVRQTYPIVVNNIPSSIKAVDAQDNKMVVLHAFIRNVGLCLRNLGRVKRSMGVDYRTLRHRISRPSLGLMSDDSPIIAVFRKNAEVFINQVRNLTHDAFWSWLKLTFEIQTAMDVFETSEIILECVYEISGARLGLIYHRQAIDEYVALAKEVEALRITSERYGSQQLKRTNPTEESGRRSTQAAYELERLTEITETKACMLNFMTERHFSEIDFFGVVQSFLINFIASV